MCKKRTSPHINIFSCKSPTRPSHAIPAHPRRAKARCASDSAYLEYAPSPHHFRLAHTHVHEARRCAPSVSDHPPRSLSLCSPPSCAPVPPALLPTCTPVPVSAVSSPLHRACYLLTSHGELTSRSIDSDDASKHCIPQRDAHLKGVLDRLLCLHPICPCALVLGVDAA